MSLVGEVNDVTKQQGLMGLQEHDLIMADEKFSGKTVKKSFFPRLLVQKIIKNNEFEKFRRSGTLI